MGTRHHAPDMFTRVMQFVWDMFETALNLGDDADRYRLFDTVHALAFLSPLCRDTREAHEDMMGVPLKTDALLRAGR